MNFFVNTCSILNPYLIRTSLDDSSSAVGRREENGVAASIFDIKCTKILKHHSPKYVNRSVTRGHGPDAYTLGKVLLSF